MGRAGKPASFQSVACAMPRFFFNLYDDGATIDEVGVELPDLGAAREAAIEEARAVISEEVRRGRVDLTHRIEVEDEARRTVLMLPFSAAVEIDGPVNKGGPAEDLD
jgi:hypothetical protein